MERLSGLIKVEGSASTFKVESVSWKRILIIDLNNYHIVVLAFFAEGMDAGLRNLLGLKLA